MKRLQKKCFILSAAFHLLLALILVVGPGFFAPKNTTEDVPALTIIPDTVIDGAFRLGGQNAKPTPAPPPPPPAPPVPESRPTPKHPEPQKTEPEPPKIKEVKKETDPLELPKQTKKKLPEVSTKPVERKKDSLTSTKKSADSDTQAREFADATRRNKEALNAARDTIKSSMASSTSVEYHGDAGYGEAVASYAQVVKSIYEHAWIPPDDTASDDAITKVTVTISRDGKVIDSHIIRASGDSLVDHSVQRTLDRVDFIRPFPEGSKDKERTYTINFNLKAKRALG